MTVSPATAVNAVRPNMPGENVIAGAVAKTIVTVSTMFKSASLQKMIFSIGVACAAVAAYLGGVMLLQLDKTVDPVEAWVVSVFLTPCVTVIVGGAFILSYKGLRKWWKWVQA